jgi:hypothetical protein
VNNGAEILPAQRDGLDELRCSGGTQRQGLHASVAGAKNHPGSPISGPALPRPEHHEARRVLEEAADRPRSSAASASPHPPAVAFPAA